MRRRNKRNGQATIEFTLVGLPLIFILVSIASVCFGMYSLHTIQESVEQGARYVITHGSTCSTGTNSCGLTVGIIADTIASAAPGVVRSSLNVRLIPNSGTGNQTTCNPVDTCHGNSTRWPPSSNGDDTPGKDVKIVADFTYTSPIAMFWPGVGYSRFGTLTLHAMSRQRLMF
jgi:Flp pilus assembly protein TadG